VFAVISESGVVNILMPVADKQANLSQANQKHWRNRDCQAASQARQACFKNLKDLAYYVTP